MDHIELFQALAARAPGTAASYVLEMWCWPILCVYDIDTSELAVEQRDEVIETRILHKRELRAMYRWLENRACSNAHGVYTESLAHVEQALVEFARTGNIDAKRFVLDVTGWTDIELGAMQQDAF